MVPMVGQRAVGLDHRDHGGPGLGEKTWSTCAHGARSGPELRRASPGCPAHRLLPGGCVLRLLVKGRPSGQVSESPLRPFGTTLIYHTGLSGN
jgi:hypothetical protein